MPDLQEKREKVARRLESMHREALAVLAHSDVPEELKPKIARLAQQSLKLAQELNELAATEQPSQSLKQRIKELLTWFALLIPFVKYLYEDRS